MSALRQSHPHAIRIVADDGQKKMIDNAAETLQRKKEEARACKNR